MRISDFFNRLNSRAGIKDINWSGGAAKEKKEISVVINVCFNDISSLINLDGNMREEEDHIMTTRWIDFFARGIKTTADVDEAIRALQELKPKIERGCTRNTICPIDNSI